MSVFDSTVASFSVGRVAARAGYFVTGLARDGSTRLSVDATFMRGPDTVAEVEDAVEQVAGLLGPDEAVVPVVWSGREGVRLTGFYRVVGARSDADSTLGAVGRERVGLDLERVPGFGAPLFEATVLGGQRAGVASPAFLPWLALPGSVDGFEIGVDLTPATATRVCQGGGVSVFSTSGGQLADARPSFFVTPQDWYVGAATLRVGGRVVVGRQVPNDLLGWVVDNGIVRVAAAAGGGFTVSSWSGSAWTLPQVVRPARKSGTDMLAVGVPHAVTVLRNAPEEVILRLVMDAASVTPGARFAVTMDLSVRRGARFVTVRLRSRGLYDWGVRVDGWSGTAVSSATSWADSTGRWCKGGEGAVSGRKAGSELWMLNDTGTNQRPFVCAVGYHTSGAASGTIDHRDSLAAQYAAAMSERIEAVAR